MSNKPAEQMTEAEKLEELFSIASRLAYWRKDGPEFEEAHFQLKKFKEKHNIS